MTEPARWFVVETECNGERHFHWVFCKTEKSASSEARAREFQRWNGYHEVKVVEVVVQ